MNAQDIIELLEKRHAKDVFFHEVAIDGGQRRMDGWALIPSYDKSMTIAYEVKVSRSDFIHDLKLQEYMAYCNEMYLVAPQGVVKDGELPEGVGLIIATEKRLVTKKKAKYREVSIPEGFYRALIASKARGSKANITLNDYEFSRRIEGLQDFTDYVEGKKSFLEIGKHVSEKLGYDISKFELSKKNLEIERMCLKNEQERFDEFVKDINIKFGFDLSSLTWNKNKTYEKVEQALTSPQQPMFDEIDKLYHEAQKLRELFKGKGECDGKETTYQNND